MLLNIKYKKIFFYNICMQSTFYDNITLSNEADYKLLGGLVG